MSSHRFPIEDAPLRERFPVDGALGTVRAHDQAAIDHFLLYAEQERQRLEAKVIEAELRCREADDQLIEATRENQRVAEELGAMWAALQADRARAEQVVTERLFAVQVEAQELAQWSEQRPEELDLTAPVEPSPAEGPSRAWSAPFGYEVPAALVHPEGPEAAAAEDAAAAAFFGGEFDDAPAWARLEEPLGIHDDLLSRHPRRQAPAPDPLDPPTTVIADGPADPVAERDFWAPEQAAATLRINQLEGTFMSLLPMLALVVVLVLVLMWVG